MNFNRVFLSNMTMLSLFFVVFVLLCCFFGFSVFIFFTSSMDRYWTVYGSMLCLGTPNKEA